MKNKVSLRLKLVIYLAVTITVTGVLTVLLAAILFELGVDYTLFHSSYVFFIVMLAVSFAIAVVASSIVTHNVLAPLKQMIRAMNQIKEGDFTARVTPEPKGKGELGQLVRNFNDMTKELQGNEMLRSDFINNFSHEFKTPIVSIRGFARQLQNQDLTEEQRKEYASIIAEEADRLANMSSNILLLTQVENQHISKTKTTFSLDEQLRKSILLYEKQWTDKDLDLDVDIDEIQYTGQESLLTHVWNNLISNAVKFSPKGGKLIISSKIDGNFVVISVEDEGPGMDEITVSKIYDKFYQGDSSHSKEGNGLGLPLVKRIVELCGGYVEVNTAVNEGTKFDVFLPVTDIVV